MKFLSISLVIGFTLQVVAQNGPPRGGNGPSLLRSGTIPDLEAVTDEGKPVKLRTLCEGKFTVLASGCLTCPEFHKSYPEVEAARVDYGSDKVQFYYFYKSLRHPELEGYVEAQNLKERLLQLSEARKKLGTKAPWLADTMDDSLRKGLGSNSQSIYLISPEGKILYANGRVVRADLRRALTTAVGAPENETATSDLKLPRIQRPAKLVNEDSKLGVKRPDGLTILKTTPKTPEKTYYVKLRAEGDEALIKTGTGRLFLGFYPDPIHDACWNNLTDPMRYTLTLPEGMKATPAEASAEKGEGDKDTKPRQFWVDITSEGKSRKLTLTLDYFGCTTDKCMALTHEYTIALEDENRGSRTYGMNRGGGRNMARGGSSDDRQGTAANRGNRGSAPGGGRRQLSDLDNDENGSVSFEEFLASARERRGGEVDPERVKQRFEAMDTNKDGKVSAEELQNAPRGRGRE